MSARFWLLLIIADDVISYIFRYYSRSCRYYERYAAILLFRFDAMPDCYSAFTLVWFIITTPVYHYYLLLSIMIMPPAAYVIAAFH